MNEIFGKRLKDIENSLVEEKKERDLKTAAFKRGLKAFISDEIQPMLVQVAEILHDRSFQTKINSSLFPSSNIAIELTVSTPDRNKIYSWQLNTDYNSLIVRLETFSNTVRTGRQEVAFTKDDKPIYETSIVNFYEKILKEQLLG